MRALKKRDRCLMVRMWVAASAGGISARTQREGDCSKRHHRCRPPCRCSPLPFRGRPQQNRVGSGMLCGDKYVADFSVTTNGLGTPKNGMDALLPSALDISHYPSADCEEALAALGKYVPFQFSVAVRMHTACSRFNADLSGTWRGPATASSSATAPASS